MAQLRRADRAKQFVPFDALTGFREALAKKERIVVPRKELCEEEKEMLDLKFQQISPRDMVSIIYYDQGEYVKITGKVSKYSACDKVLYIVDKKIHFSDIAEIHL
ncbi:MAG: YolD-like family protein [Agathobacter sp.]|nr:YolD-like family protein [Agathobacter sp.]